MQREPTIVLWLLGASSSDRTIGVFLVFIYSIWWASCVTTLYSAIHIKTLRVIIHGEKQNKKESKQRLRIFSRVLGLPLLALPCKLHGWRAVLQNEVKVCDSLSGLICCIRRYTWVFGYNGRLSISISSNTLLWWYMLYTLHRGVGDHSKCLSVKVLGHPGRVYWLLRLKLKISRRKMPFCCAVLSQPGGEKTSQVWAPSLQNWDKAFTRPRRAFCGKGGRRLL